MLPIPATLMLRRRSSPLASALPAGQAGVAHPDLSVSNQKRSPRYPSCMRLEFVVVAYKSSGELTGCLDSIASDSPAGSKVVVVDNSSPDDSATVAGSHPLRPRIVSSTKNLGFGGGCNLGSEGSD